MNCKRYVLALLLFLAIMVSGCAGSGADSQNTDLQNSAISEDDSTDKAAADDSIQPLSPEEDTVKVDFASSTPENDTDVGLKNIKIDTAEMELTDEQKAVLSFFDDDYLSVPGYEFLRRYPQVFEDAQLTLWGSVVKVISIDDNSYELVLWLDVGGVDWEYVFGDYPNLIGEYLLLSGQTGDTWFMEGDTLEVYGRYVGIETIEIDGVSYTVPKVSVQREIFAPGKSYEYYGYTEKFDLEDVKTVAKAIFGNDIEVRRPIVGTDVSEMQSGLWDEAIGCDPCYLVELEDQSNAKFSKYFFFTASDLSAYGEARIADAKDAVSNDFSHYNPTHRNIEFSADFQHFFLFTYNDELEDLTLEYYDHDLNKIWEREFSETTTAMYDYTKNNIYLLANNELYIINIETGEDTFTPSYVGPKVELRKLRDGILMISKNKSDGVMKCALDGTIMWKANLPIDALYVDGVQLVNNNIVIEEYYWCSTEDYGTRYVVLDNESGNIIVDASSIG